ncbi:hypothetical protein MHUMG1_10372 [Metarhizium humberi]|uniref:Uncharacterized protein n=1 Tax=Metarhizium humberi TaxID=2596975 RepID=A0A9P8M1Y9_9HYPO|nr:hypothetical protein MHUMG1_10372 [Metarhizium humberi]
MGDFITTNGYANYQIEGTDTTVVIHGKPNEITDGAWWAGGSAANTETQIPQPVTSWRAALDMRIASVENGTFYDAHINDDTDRYWDEAKTNEFYDKLQAINNRCPANIPNDISFTKLPMKTFLEANSGKGCDLLSTDGRRDPSHEATATNPASTMPTIISTMQALAIGLKLDMLSQNFHMSSSKIALSKKPFGASRW